MPFIKPLLQQLVQRSNFSPPPPPPQHPTPPWNENVASVGGSPQPPPTTPPLKEHSVFRGVPSPPPPPSCPLFTSPVLNKNYACTSGPLEPVPALKGSSAFRDKSQPLPPPPPPPPCQLTTTQILNANSASNSELSPSPPPPMKEKAVSPTKVPPPPPPPLPMKDSSSFNGGPSPPPPPLLPAVQTSKPANVSAMPRPPPSPSPPPPPPPHTPPMKEKAVSPTRVPPPPPPPLPMKDNSSFNGGPSPPPPPPLPAVQTSKPANVSAMPSPPPGSPQSVPSAPPPPVPSLKSGLKAGSGLIQSASKAAVPTSGQGSSGGKRNSGTSMWQKPEKVQLVDHMRAYNCEIMLSKLKIPLLDMLSSVVARENSALDVDQVENLIKFYPTKEEMETLKGYKGEKEKLGRCEQFMLEFMQLPRAESKLRVFSFTIQFESQVSELMKSLNIVNLAADQIKGSSKLRTIMQTILSLGNALNQGTFRGSAVGFRLDSLLKLTETRARNNKMTVMHYLCKVLAEKLPELLDFSEDLSSLEPCAKIQLKFLAEEMRAIFNGLEKVEQELSMSKNDGAMSKNFRKALKEFLCYAEAEVRSLAQLYSVVGRNADALAQYFGEDPARWPFEQVITTLLDFRRMFNQALEENRKQLEFERKKAEKEALEKQKMSDSEKT